MISYSDIDQQKKAFIFELDDVLFPEKDYLFQVYYLFANFLEYQEMLDSKVLVSLMKTTFEEEGKDAVFNKVLEKFKIDENYRENFDRLLLNAKLPLKLLLYQRMLNFLQDIVMDRKKIFILTNGEPDQQLNKIHQTEWNGLENYLICYFADEIYPKPQPETFMLLMRQHQLEPSDIVIIGNSAVDEKLAQHFLVDYVQANDVIG
ncbi:MAG: HAD family hydrolase [Sphingobacteriaceae bacterium]